jgi:uncharacterized protein (DUF1330 family)
MAAYCVFILKSVKDRAKLDEYWAKAGPTMKGFGVKPLAAYTPFKLLEGNDAVKAVVLAEFPSMEEAQRWYDSPGYSEVRKHRLAGGEFLTLLLDGGLAKGSDRL